MWVRRGTRPSGIKADWTLGNSVTEFGFELALCSYLEAESGDLVARQIGGAVVSPASRILDVVCIDTTAAVERRATITPDSIPVRAILAPVGPGRYRRPKTVFDGPPSRTRRFVDCAVEVGFFERERRSGQEYVRQVCRYPDWFREIVAIENKPDLDRPGAMARQLRTDVALGIADRVILATETYVTRAHLNRIPTAVGVWRVHRTGPVVEDIEIIREAEPLPTDAWGIEPGDREPGQTAITPVTPQAKQEARLRIAERAFGDGWRPRTLPACANCNPPAPAHASLPVCSHFDRIVEPNSDCGPDCPAHTLAPARTDLTVRRAERTPWDRSPGSFVTTQSGLDRYGSD